VDLAARSGREQHDLAGFQCLSGIIAFDPEEKPRDDALSLTLSEISTDAGGWS
jgi:hypothetical protein